MSTLLADGLPRTITVPNGDAQVLAGQIPQVGRFVVESVVASIDATGAGDVTPELTILDPSGVVIATKQQTKPVAGGTTGTATWALRLTDEATAAVTPAALDLLFEFTITGAPQAAIDTFVDGPMAGPLPQTYNVLEAWAVGRSNNAAIGSLLDIRFNLDNGNHYAVIDIEEAGAPPTLAQANAVTQNRLRFHSAGNLGPAGAAGALQFAIPNYASTLFGKSFVGAGGIITQTVGDNLWNTRYMLYSPLVGISRVTLSSLGSLVAGSSLYVYGRK